MIGIESRRIDFGGRNSVGQYISHGSWKRCCSPQRWCGCAQGSGTWVRHPLVPECRQHEYGSNSTAVATSTFGRCFKPVRVLLNFHSSIYTFPRVPRKAPADHQIDRRNAGSPTFGGGSAQRLRGEACLTSSALRVRLRCEYYLRLLCARCD